MPLPAPPNSPPPVAGAPSPGLPGWLKVRLKGCAAEGAVEVLGGAAKVRAPREPELMPPPTRASADDIASIKGSASDKTTAIALTMPRARSEKCMSRSFVPGGTALSTSPQDQANMGSAAQK